MTMISNGNSLLCHRKLADDVLFATNYYFSDIVSLLKKIWSLLVINVVVCIYALCMYYDVAAMEG